VSMTKNSVDSLGSLSTSKSGVFFTPAALETLRNASAINAMTVQWTTDPYGWSNDSIAAGVTTIELFDPDSGAPLPVDGASQPLLIALTLPSSTDESLFACNFWDATTLSWSQQGTIVIDVSADASGSVTAVCGALHLTDFSGAISTSFLHVNVVDPIRDASKLANLFQQKSIVVVVAVGLLLGIFLVAWVASTAIDAKLSETLEQLQRTHVMLYGEVKPGLGKELLATSASIQDAVLKENTFRRIKTAYDKLQEAKARGRTTLVVTYLVMMWTRNMRVDHSWLSVVIPPLDEQLVVSRPQRVACLCALILANMFISALFMGTEPGAHGCIRLCLPVPFVIANGLGLFSAQRVSLKRQ
jgi:hypothetical protein